MSAKEICPLCTWRGPVELDNGVCPQCGVNWPEKYAQYSDALTVAKERIAQLEQALEFEKGTTIGMNVAITLKDERIEQLENEYQGWQDTIAAAMKRIAALEEELKKYEPPVIYEEELKKYQSQRTLRQ